MVLSNHEQPSTEKCESVGHPPDRAHDQYYAKKTNVVVCPSPSFGAQTSTMHYDDAVYEAVIDRLFPNVALVSEPPNSRNIVPRFYSTYVHYVLPPGSALRATAALISPLHSVRQLMNCLTAQFSCN